MTGGSKKRQEQQLMRGGKKLRMGAKKQKREEWSESTECEERERESKRGRVREGGREEG